MNKKIYILALIVLISTFSIMSYGETAVNILFNGKPIAFDAGPIIIDGNTLVQMEPLFETFGLKYEWDSKHLAVEGTKEDFKIVLTLDEASAVVNDKVVSLDVAPQSIDGIVYVPLRYMAETLECHVGWNGETRTVSIEDAFDGSDWIIDGKLEHAIRIALDKPQGALSHSDLKSIQTLNTSYYGIENLEGIQYLKNLEHLDLSGNHLKSIAILSELKGLKSLKAQASEIESLGGIEGLTLLEDLNVDNNKISDISPLKALVHLKTLRLSDNEISDIASLQYLTALNHLSMAGNQISDIHVLANLTELEELLLMNNTIDDIEMLKDLKQLKTLDLGKNNIKNITVLECLPQLTYLGIPDNKITDMSSLLNLTDLEGLDISNNPANIDKIIDAFDNVEY